MRPLYLKLERFLGLEKVELDFPSDLFVIVGPNGAGKSSLLEAMYFALYGRGIRVERSKKELIHRGSSDKALRVQFEFSVAGGRFRVTREYSVKQGGVAYLERYEGERWKPLASGEQGVNACIEALLGCDALTFRSSVFLPQGETLAFVEASSADRFKTLSSLFGLDILDTMREKVRDTVRLLEGELGPLREKLRFLEAADLEKERSRLREEEGVLDRELVALQEYTMVLRERLEKMKKFREVAREVREYTKRIGDLKRKHAELLRLVEEDEAVELAHRLHETFEKPWKQVKELVALMAREEEKEEELLEETTKALKETEETLSKLLEDEAFWKKEKEKVHEFIHEIETRGKPLFEAFVRCKGEFALWEEKEGELRTRIAGLLEEEERLKEEETRRKEALHEKEVVLSQVEERYARIEEALQILDELLPEEQRKAQELERLRQEWQKLRKEVEQCDEQIQKLTSEKENLEARLKVLEARKDAYEAWYRQGVKVFVVGELEEEWRRQGVCPVCGSRVPFPEGERERVDIVALEREYRNFQEEWMSLLSRKDHLEEEVEKVSLERERKRAELEEVQRMGASLSQEWHELRKKIAETLDFSGYPSWEGFTLSHFREWVRSKGKEKEALQKELEVQRRKLSELQGRLRFLEEERKKEEKRLLEVGARKERVHEELKSQERLFVEYCSFWGIPGDNFSEFLEDLRAKLKEAEQEELRIGGEIKAKRERIDFLALERMRLAESIKRRREERETLTREEARLRELFLTELEKRQWTEATYRRFLERTPGKSREELHRLEGELEGLTRQKAEKEKEKRHFEEVLGLSEEALETALPKLEEELVSLEKKMHDLHKRIGEIREGIRQNEEKQREWKELKVRVGEKSKVYEIHTELQRALEVGGFKNYLLQILFARLEKESSRILLGLSGGRYALRMQMNRGMADIAVLDRKFGGGERLPEECSGGEKTLIALALALALSGLRLEERYARRTECLFIDEGFSTLDREHLDLVADAIFRLSREGKMVGIVTHDPDFAGYFPVQLEVREGMVRWKRSEGLAI
ncbi:MAG: SMC family ATPase [Atribacterota bacterium]